MSELLGRVADSGDTVVIEHRGRPMARLVPLSETPASDLADVRGWLDDDDPFFTIIEGIVERRRSRAPRAAAEAASARR